jgi:proteic killer suppression protein
MEVRFRTNKLQKTCEDPKEAKKQHGVKVGEKIVLRINEFRAAKNLSIIAKLPAARLHMLEGDRKGEFAVDLAHPFRLVFTAVIENQPHEGIAIDMNHLEIVQIVRVEEITDYHGKQKRK